MDTINTENVLLDILNEHRDGISEYDLIRQLEADSGETQTNFSNSLELFRVHFFVHHLLYRLRDRLWSERLGHLHISPLEIKLSDYSEAQAGLAHYDALREYYLDFANLENTTKEEIETMLNRFWRRYATADDKTDALKVFNLKEPLTRDDIKRRYRELVREHHPDRGGDQERLQEINRAMDVLKRHYPN